MLFEIDPRPFQAVLEQAQAKQGQAQAQLGLAKINVNRDTPLAQARAIARANWTTRCSKRRRRSSGEDARGRGDNANLNLGFTKVRSLIAGVAGQATTQVGNLVNPQSVLTSVSQLNPIKVYFSISDSEYLALTRARPMGAAETFFMVHRSIPLTLTLANGEGIPHRARRLCRSPDESADRIHSNCGRVSEPRQHAASGPVRAESRLRPRFCTTRFLFPRRRHRVSGPGAGLRCRNDNTVHVKTVTLGAQVGNNWVVKTGSLPATW